MNKIILILLLVTTGAVMACNSISSSSNAKVSKPASATKPVKKSEGDDVYIVPNHFPLKDGILPKQDNNDKKNKSKKDINS